MNPVLEEAPWKRVRRGAITFALGLFMALGVVWASRLGMEDRSSRDRRIPLDLSAACVLREGPTAVAYFGGLESPTGWRCAWITDDQWESAAISPDEGCQLLHGRGSAAHPAGGDTPFAWYCSR